MISSFRIDFQLCGRYPFPVSVQLTNGPYCYATRSFRGPWPIPLRTVRLQPIIGLPPPNQEMVPVIRIVAHQSTRFLPGSSAL
jgi:hypothetical protein